MAILSVFFPIFDHSGGGLERGAEGPKVAPCEGHRRGGFNGVDTWDELWATMGHSYVYNVKVLHIFYQ